MCAYIRIARRWPAVGARSRSLEDLARTARRRVERFGGERSGTFGWWRRNIVVARIRSGPFERKDGTSGNDRSKIHA